ncbi:RloB family protein [Parabacteroides sp. APC149_11_2_Y6]
MRKIKNPRQSRKVIHIICEGTHTEPQFFGSIRDRVIDGKYNIGNCEINIIPKPINSDDSNIVGTVEPRGSYKPKKKRTAIKDAETEVEILKGFPVPLNWIKTAQEILRERREDEAWAVFDKDGHPAIAEAFAAAGEEIGGRKVGIAFSSRSFEYYLLLHFEYIYKEFNATECKGYVRNKLKPLNCMLADAKEGSCNGDKCINGYARSKGYWNESKKIESMFPLVEDRLLIGIVNAYRLREESNNRDSRLIYQKNPYVTTDGLICRLTNTQVIGCRIPFNLKYDDIPIELYFFQDCWIYVQNKSSDRILILPEDFFLILNYYTNRSQQMLERIVLQPKEEVLYENTSLKRSEIIIINPSMVGGINYLFCLHE